jgi:hypothetical protein
MDNSGFREIWFKDSSFGFTEGPNAGRWAWLIANRAEFMQINYVEHFIQSGLTTLSDGARRPPPGWWIAGNGTVSETNDDGGAMRLATGENFENSLRLQGAGSQWAFFAEMHAEFALSAMSHTSNIVVWAGFVDQDYDMISLPGDGVMFLFDPDNLYGLEPTASKRAYWRALMRKGGSTVYHYNSQGFSDPQGRQVSPAGTGRVSFRFEGWPAGDAGFTYDSIKPYIDGINFGGALAGTYPNNYGFQGNSNDTSKKGLRNSGETLIQWNTNLRPFFGVMTRTSGAGTSRFVHADLFKAYANEPWRYT